MPSSSQNLNLRRRPGLGVAASIAAIAMRPWLPLFRRRNAPAMPVTVFQAYMVGDFFMALPALKKIGSALPLRVICRPDCVALLAAEGIEGIPFANAFNVRPGVGTFLSTLREAFGLRGKLGALALDLDADPRTAFWLRIAGARAVSYRRDFGMQFDETFPLPPDSIHQADRDARVAEEFLRRYAPFASPAENENASAPENSPASSGEQSNGTPRAWIVSCRTRKVAKNWPLDHWDALLERLEAARVPFVLLVPPDADPEFLAFRERWRARAPLLKGSLPEISEAVSRSAGVLATDNFLGHLAGYRGKPVLWINLCSPARQVEPKGPATLRVGAEDPAAPIIPSVEEVWRAFETLRASP